MKPFHTIAVPHRDILEGSLTLDVFAADLWQVFRGEAPDEYKDPTQFFQKTYETKELNRLLSIVERRLNGLGRDAVIQLQTPFGGGKTHALIAMYHKAGAWDANRVVLVGTPMSATDTLWAMLEKQLTGKLNRFDSRTSPGRDAIYELLLEKQPVLILMDEVLEYLTKAAGVQVGDSTLASQTLAFMQELTEAVGILEKVALVFTLPSSRMEHYGKQAEWFFNQLQHVGGRVEKIHTPVQEHEISEVIRHRLFASINQGAAAEVIREFMEYAASESLLPPGMEPSVYQKQFEAAYPFLPETVDVLYQRWGSFPNFQRTRGVLRLLAIVLNAVREEAIPYISVADFDFDVQEIRRELLKHIGQEYDSVIAADITGENAGAKQVDTQLGNAYKGFRLGSRAARTVFLYSFSGGTEKGASPREIKRSATTTEHPASVVAEASELLRGKLFYLQQEKKRSYFTNQPNLNHILLTRMENITRPEIEKVEETALKNNLSSGQLKTFIWPKDGSDIPDNVELKLILLKVHDEALMNSMLEEKGDIPRANRNTLFFLVPSEPEQTDFYNQLEKLIAYRALKSDKTLRLSPEQQKKVRDELKKAEDGLNHILRRYYRTLFIPTKDGLKKEDLGVPTYDESKLDKAVYDKLKLGEEILESIHPLVIQERYLTHNESVSTTQLYQSSIQTPGEARVISQEVWKLGIQEGVQQGLFGLGELEGGEPVYHYFKEYPLAVAFSENEVIIREDICITQQEAKKDGNDDYSIKDIPQPDIEEDENKDTEAGIDLSPPVPSGRNQVHLQFTVPKGQVAGLMGVMNLLQRHFNNLQLELRATGGEMSEQDYEDKIREAFIQLGINVDD